MRLIFFLVFKNLFSGQNKRFLSFMNLVSILGVAIGVCALIVVLAVMEGFDRELVRKIVGMDAHIHIQQAAGIERVEQIMPQLELIPGVLGVAPEMTGQVIVRQDRYVQGILVRGIDFNREIAVSELARYIDPLFDASKLAPLNTIVLGVELARQLRVGVGDVIDVISPVATVKENKRRPVVEPFTIVGLFQSQMYDYDLNIAYMSLDSARSIFRIEEPIVSAIHVKTDRPDFLRPIQRKIEQVLGAGYSVRTWYERNRNFFSALKLEKTAMFIILTLIVTVAVFNIVSTLSVMVVEKTKEIGILKALGTSPRVILMIFSLQGFLIGLIGVMLGASFGLGLCYALARYQFIKLPADVYYVTSLPVFVDGLDVSLVCLVAFVLSLAASVYPAIRASRLHPVEALRYE